MIITQRKQFIEKEEAPLFFNNGHFVIINCSIINHFIIFNIEIFLDVLNPSAN